ncbi:MAG TPA: helix-turn-helix domain-containing protein [Spirochaetota bacterium]|nr:helix-turn-helix domain-containing protein [Spirochaetota bacterium]HPR47244.1 helix-turn-helix domain-containing protein [Spirochaetota bacterium]
MLSAELKNIEKLWPSVAELLSVPHNKKDYNNLCKRLDELVDEVGNNDKHPLALLMETIGLLIEKYEEEKYTINQPGVVTILKELMSEHGLKQSDLREIGSQGVVSEILHGKRELNIRQIKLLAKKFSVSPSVFI